MARDQQRALILMDIQLPGISGVEAFRQLGAAPAIGR
jgi:CheY-like chemotaxis protein